MNNNTKLSDLSFPDDYFCDEIRDGFFVSETMKHNWAASLKVLSEIDVICRRHNINWYADSGTLIGAIRHKGFIPWDDDIDISMFRADFEMFLSFAQEELPKEYCILYENLLGTERNHFYDFNNPFCAIANRNMVSDDEHFVVEHFGFPLHVGVDVFIMDNVFEDPKEEEERVQRARLIYSTYWGIINNTFTLDDVKLLLPIIEKDNNVSIKAEDAQRELLRLFIDVSKECQDDDSQDVALMYIWVMNGKYRYKRSYYGDGIWCEFENVAIRIPENYDDILTDYYGDYMKKVKGGADHNYPGYKEKEAIYREMKGRNPIRYCFKRKDFVPINDRRNLRHRLKDMFALMHDMHNYAQGKWDSSNYENMVEILQSAQNAAISIGNLLEEKYGEGISAVALLEQYCEMVYKASIEFDDDIKTKLDDLLSNAEVKTEELISDHGLDVLFLPCKASWWESMRDIFLWEDNNKSKRVKVIPIPYYYQNYYGMLGSMRRDSEEFEKIAELDGKITNFDEYDIAKRHPDMIVIQFPYDGSSSAMGIPGLLYSSSLAQYTDRLVYVPYLNPDPPESEDDVAAKAMIELVEQPAVFNSDYVIVGSEELREYYINILVEMTDVELKAYWEKRIILKNNLDVIDC